MTLTDPDVPAVHELEVTQKTIGLAELPRRVDAVGSLPVALALTSVEYASLSPASAYWSACSPEPLSADDSWFVRVYPMAVAVTIENTTISARASTSAIPSS